MVQQVFIGIDKGFLLHGVQLARDRLRLAVLHAEAVQQRDQPGAALVFNAELPGDPGANLIRAPRQGLGDPGFQPLLLLIAQPTGTALIEAIASVVRQTTLCVNKYRTRSG